MIKVLNKIGDYSQELIEICRSSSGICGAQLRNAHYILGKEVGKIIISNENLNGLKIALIIMMRAGLPFGLGLADYFDENYNIDIFFSPVLELDSKYDVVIIADAVINTGRTIFDMIDSLKHPNVIIATNVISEKYIQNWINYKVYATRISNNSYKGSKVTVVSNGKGPDTGDRLFCNSFFK